MVNEALSASLIPSPIAKVKVCVSPLSSSTAAKLPIAVFKGASSSTLFSDNVIFNGA